MGGRVGGGGGGMMPERQGVGCSMMWNDRLAERRFLPF